MKHLIFVFSLIILASCDDGWQTDFYPMSNMPKGDTVWLDMDMKNAVTEGIIIPSATQQQSGFGMDISVKGKSHKELFYKIYYQNESYKFGDNDNLAHENFYGSWEDVGIGFKPIEGKNTSDFVRIVGNPRDERIYYGEDLSQNPYSEQRISSKMDEIRNTPEWYESIVQKAKNNNVTVESQLYSDAVWIIDESKNSGDHNNRWKRSPRAGVYSFMLVVCDKQGLDMIPDHIKNIGLTNEDGQFVNPYGWFAKNTSSHIKVIKSDRVLKTRAVLAVDKGIFVKSGDRNDDCQCANNDQLYREALYEQFLSDVSRQYTLRNIPLIRDVVDDEPYSPADYEAADRKYRREERSDDYPVVATEPCKTVRVADDGSYISIVNPGSTPDDMKKESTGIRSRVGFTYGKWRAKIKFPPMLNDDNMWNGLTYAFWLIYSDQHPWNYRRHNEVAGGYIDKGDDSENPVRHTDYHYSEIDIEIVKASKYWPENYYPSNVDDNSNIAEAQQSSDVMYCCTNWDLASHEPANFRSGIDTIKYQNKEFETNRWTELYKALTSREPMPNSIFSEPYYYYEIEWRPTEIIWRVGPSPDKMQVMGYMNDKYTSIPNNQMRCIVTQEYHYSEWWPPIVWEQGLIPYNKTDIEGRVYEVVVE